MKKQLISEEFQRMQKLAGLITKSQLNEALNKDIKQFGKDLDDKFKAAGFNTLITMQPPTSEQQNTVKTNPNAAIFEVSQNQDAQMLTVYINPKMISKAESIINKFQLSNYDGSVLQRRWTAKQVKGAINPGDIVKQDADKNKGIWYFYRLAKVDTKVKTISSTQPQAESLNNENEHISEAKEDLFNKYKSKIETLRDEFIADLKSNLKDLKKLSKEDKTKLSQMIRNLTVAVDDALGEGKEKLK